MATSTATLTPVELRNGRWYKREDLHAGPYGVNGAKLRACQHLIGQAAAAGARSVISAASVLSPQNAMAAVVAAQYGLACTVVLGGTRADTAQRHPAVRIAVAAGAELAIHKVGYNTALQSAAGKLAAADPGAYWLRYGITPPPEATTAELRAFHAVGAEQVRNLPDGVRRLVVPFGSGNTAASVLYGVAQHAPASLTEVVLVGIGPDRLGWLRGRLALLAARVPVPLSHVDLHGSGWVRYGDRMPETRDGIVMHPTYEGKVIRYLDEYGPDWWRQRDDSTCLWIVGGPLPGTPTARARRRPARG